MMYISTDYVFDGQGTTPWEPDCKDYTPLNVYGQTKLDGELAVSGHVDKYFHRAYCMGIWEERKEFYQDHAKCGQDPRSLDVWSTTRSVLLPIPYDLARLLVDMIVTDKYGYYHATNEGGYISWYDFTKEIFRQAAALGHSGILQKTDHR